jgi:bifunctional polynucleotide phosphatase/kinase
MIIQMNMPSFRKDIAFFDYDWTLVRPKSGGTFPKGIDDWQWLHPLVPVVLKELYDKGFAVVIVTNQSKPWKITQIQSALATLEFPLSICIASDRATYKPSLALMHEAFSKESLELIDHESSFFVGDALGRPTDHSDSDLKFAQAFNLRVMPPEEIFPIERVAVPVVTPSQHQEVIIMVGMPGSGKTTVANDVFGKAGYFVVHGDEHKTSAKMIKTALPELLKGRSVVFDATNSSKKKRTEYIQVAQKNNVVNVRCVYMNTSLEEALVRNAKRAKPVPRIAYSVYHKNFEMPSEDEGCSVLVV